MKVSQVNRKIEDFLRDLANEDTLCVRKTTVHPV